MKKLILIGIFAAGCVPVFAQETFFEGFYSPAAIVANHDMQNRKTAKSAKSNSQKRSWGCVSGFCAQLGANLSAMIKPVETSEVEWVQEVQQQENAACATDLEGLTAARDFKIMASNNEIAKRRIMGIQALVATHPVITQYKFFAPQPSDMAGLNDTQFAFLRNFLGQPTDKAKFDKQYTPVVSHPTNNAPETQLTFNNVDGKTMILLINSTQSHKKIFFFVNRVPNS